MTSLVSYDDSDSEPDVWKTEIPNGSNQGKSLDCPTTFQTKHFSADELDPGKPYKQKSITNIGDICPDSVNEDSKPFPVTYSSKVSLDTCSGSTSPYLCYKSQGQSLDSLLKSVTVPANVQKRVHEDHVFPAVGIKPYIPKRMRQEQPSALKNLTKDGEKQKQPPDSTIKPVKGEEHLSSMTFRVSETIKPYLEAKYKATEISRSLVFQMCEHQGPVNKVQWCPVQQYSHMLLSASMDKSFKVWDAVDTGSCLKTYLCHSGAVRDVQWSSCGRVVLSGGFDSMLYLTDIETGKPLFSSENEFKISTLKFHPTDRNVFVCGGFSPSIRAWDIRDCKERYTCPCLTLHPKDSTFVAQTNGNYMALFSTQWPYKINKKKRYEEHKVEGFAVGCEFSPDGSLLATGSSEGRVFLYNYNTSRVVRNFPAHNQACVNVSFHPVLPSLFATSDWSGEIKIWQ
uniref:WD repeat-containing protein 25 isoform X2 n=1 Tax=Geotrypetes seraphini TaxID=260995 RepID=A0A6P8RPI0_GEOSA|nr:WD repeat-containing protein 25 isoform X2 [Geotrypetes seraphini]